MGDVKVVRQKTDQADYDQQHITLHQAILDHAHRIAKKPDEARAEAH
jgi:hypothetical protein